MINSIIKKLKEMEINNFEANNINLKKDIELAMKNSTLTAKLDKNILISEYDSKIARSTFLPKVDLEYGYESLEDRSFSRTNEEWQWKLGVKVKWDIFNFGSGIDSVDFLKTETELREAQINAINSQLDYFVYYQQYLSLLK
ncbi:MAG: TolC family protein [Fusobacteriaceae bacterium]